MRSTQTKLHKRRFSQEHCIKHKLFITFHQTLFRAANFHAGISAKDQTVFNTIPSSEGAYETVHVHILAITLTATCNTEIGSDLFYSNCIDFSMQRLYMRAFSQEHSLVQNNQSKLGTFLK